MLPVEGKSPVSIFFGETALHCKLMVPGLHQTKPYCADSAICCGLAALQLIQILPSPARISRDFAKAIKKCCSSSFKLITLVEVDIEQYIGALLTHLCTHLVHCDQLGTPVEEACFRQNEWGGGGCENFTEESPYPRCLCTSQTWLPFPTSPP